MMPFLNFCSISLKTKYIFIFFLECIATFHVVAHLLKVLSTEVVAELSDSQDGIDQFFGIVLSGELAQRTEVISAEHGGNNNLRLPCGCQFGIHHDAGNASVTIRERVNLADHKEHEKGAGKGVTQGPINLEALFQRATHLLESEEAITISWCSREFFSINLCF